MRSRSNLYVMAEVDDTYLAAAWACAILRALHGAVHCTANIVIARFDLYLLSTPAAWFIAARAAGGYFTA
jgi:hypothetical protein